MIERIDRRGSGGALVLFNTARIERLRALVGPTWDDKAATLREGPGSVTNVRLPRASPRE